MRRGSYPRRRGSPTRGGPRISTVVRTVFRTVVRSRRRPSRSLWGVGLLLALASALAAQETPGRIEGVVQRPDGSRVPGVTVVAEEADTGSGVSAITDEKGRFEIAGLTPGTYALSFSLGTDLDTVPPVEVTSGATSRVTKTVDWRYVVAETLTVYSASRRTERIVEAPAAVSVVSHETIELAAPTGELPKLFESLPGAEITQSGLFDFKLNVRGVNGLVNRRVAVLIDGRNPSFPLLDTQEWHTLSFPLDEIATAELVRGPSSALYGANAFNGVLNLTTRAPADELGGEARLTLGDLSTTRVDFRVAQGLGEGLFLKALGSYQESDDYYRSRNQTLEYSKPCLTQALDCLFLEPVPLPLDRDRVAFAGVRFDKDFDESHTLVVETSTSDSKGPVFTTSAGRFQLTDVDGFWVRSNFHTPRWNLLAYYNDRDAAALTMSAGTPSYSDSFRLVGEWQGWWELAGGRGRIVGGTFLSTERVDTAGPDGVPTLLFDVARADKQAVFAQLDWELSDRLKLVAAARWDDNTLHDPQVSPKASLVFAATPRHTLRLSYNEAFQTPNYPEFFLRVPLAPPADLSPFEAFCAPLGLDCGFGRPVELLAVGNENLNVETIESAELGYRGLLGNRAYMTVDYYRTEIQDFVQLLVPQLGTRLGRANPAFGPWQPPADLPGPVSDTLLATLEGALGPLFPLLSNDPITGDPIFVLNTIVNFGRVETQGAELALDVSIDRQWSFDANYSWLDFNVRDELAEAPLESNGPKHKVNLGLTYNDKRISAAVHYRWVDSFRWSEGLVRGPVPSYDVVNVAGIYRLSDSWELGVNVSNLFDDVHYEAFSGDLLERRVLGHLGFSW
jgi:outer membrane receptor for ferrienterochelin and colicins